MENTTIDSKPENTGFDIKDPKILFSVVGASFVFCVLIILGLWCACCSGSKRKRRRSSSGPTIVVLSTQNEPVTTLKTPGVRKKKYNKYNQFKVPAPRQKMETRLPSVDPEIEEMAKAMTRKIALMLESIKIDPSRITKCGHLGKGQFGIVYKGILTTQNGKEKKEVALKTIAGDASNEVDMENFTDELMKMTNFKHRNVMQIIGLTIMEEKPYIVLPFMQNGDLRSYIRSKKKKLCEQELLKMARQVASGMDYLTKQNLIHGDLAARNCMVDKKLRVKVADFGLSRHLYQSEYYKTKSTDETPRPIRWMAIEAIVDYKYSVKSDVWSFGVLLWELMTRGIKPYPDLPSNSDVINQVKHGRRMTCPNKCDKAIYDVMMKCWDNDPHNRPNFQDLVQMIGELIVEDHEYLTAKMEV